MTHLNKSDMTEYFEKPLNVLIALDEQLLVEAALKSDHKPRAHESRTHWIENSISLFRNIRKILLYFLQQRYTIYPITEEELRCKPWQDSTKLLLLITRDPIDESQYLKHNESVCKYREAGGCFVIADLTQVCDANSLVNVPHSPGDAFSSQLFLQLLRTNLSDDFLKQEISCEKPEVFGPCVVPSITPHYIFSDLRQKFAIKTDQIKNVLKGSAYEILDQIQSSSLSEEPTKEKLAAIIAQGYTPIVFDTPPADQFAVDTYFANLQTQHLGHIVTFSEVAKSTHPLCEKLSSLEGLVVIANQQVEGKGRGENHWISPQGSISFSFNFSISKNTKLFHSLGFVQHLASMAVVQAIQRLPGFEDFDVKIKWPNDIYWSNKHKLVGILTTSKMDGQKVQFFIGCGINLANKFPSRSLHNLAQETCKTSNELPTSEKLVASILCQIEELLVWFETVSLDDVKKRYLNLWGLTGRAIRLRDGTEADILGIDDDGYLSVKMCESGEKKSLHPDGNRFDMIRNLQLA